MALKIFIPSSTLSLLTGCTNGLVHFTPRGLSIPRRVITSARRGSDAKSVRSLSTSWRAEWEDHAVCRPSRMRRVAGGPGVELELEEVVEVVVKEVEKVEDA
jgi:hypothetical protein